MIYEGIIRIIGIILQAVVIIIAWKALSVWKIEIRGRDKYSFSKNLLEYIKDIRFLVFTRDGSFYQIFLNDILVNKKEFYTKTLKVIEKDKLYFDQHYFLLFDHINTRADILVPKRIRIALDALYPSSAKVIDREKSKYTYIHLNIDKGNTDKVRYLDDAIYEFSPNEDITIGNYFRKWEVLIKELQKA